MGWVSARESVVKCVSGVYSRTNISVNGIEMCRQKPHKYLTNTNVKKLAELVAKAKHATRNFPESSQHHVVAFVTKPTERCLTAIENNFYVIRSSLD